MKALAKVFIIVDAISIGLVVSGFLCYLQETVRAPIHVASAAREHNKDIGWFLNSAKQFYLN